MKGKEQKVIKGYHAVKEMRRIRDKISEEIADMNYKQLKAYFKQTNDSIGQKHKDYLERRAKRGNAKKFKRVLANVSEAKPIDEDRIKKEDDLTSERL
jgi:hypothetical protein